MAFWLPRFRVWFVGCGDFRWFGLNLVAGYRLRRLAAGFVWMLAVRCLVRQITVLASAAWASPNSWA
jgi:hypothetical protein